MRQRPHRATGWQPVWRGVGEAPASIVAGGLEARGIRTRSNGPRILSHAYPTGVSNLVWTIYVPSHDAQRARDTLLDRGEAANIVDDEAGFSLEQAFVLRLAVAGILALVCISALGVLFWGWAA